MHVEHPSKAETSRRDQHDSDTARQHARHGMARTSPTVHDTEKLPVDGEEWGEREWSWGVTSSKFRTACDLTPTSCDDLDACKFQALITLVAGADRCCSSIRPSTSDPQGYKRSP